MLVRIDRLSYLMGTSLEPRAARLFEMHSRARECLATSQAPTTIWDEHCRPILLDWTGFFPGQRKGCVLANQANQVLNGLRSCCKTRGRDRVSKQCCVDKAKFGASTAKRGQVEDKIGRQRLARDAVPGEGQVDCAYCGFD